ncbi:MAG: hypothetical protein AAGC45_12865 [Bacteroidota bacterium]
MELSNLNPEEFRNLAQGFQAIIISIAAIIGTAWGIIKLYASKELDKSRLETLSLKKEYERRQGLSGEISVQIGEPSQNNSTPIFFKCEIKNESSETHILDWENYPMKIALISETNKWFGIQPEIEAKLVDAYLSPNKNKRYWAIHHTLTLLPYSSKTLSFYWECKKPGIYLASVSSKMPKSIVRFIKRTDEDNKFAEAIQTLSSEFPDTFNDELEFSISEYFQVIEPRDSGEQFS